MKSWLERFLPAWHWISAQSVEWGHLKDMDTPGRRRINWRDNHTETVKRSDLQNILIQTILPQLSAASFTLVEARNLSKKISY